MGTDNCKTFELVPADGLVFGQDDPTALADRDEPRGVGCVLSEVVIVSDDMLSSASKAIDDDGSTEGGSTKNVKGSGSFTSLATNRVFDVRHVDCVVSREFQH